MSFTMSHTGDRRLLQKLERLKVAGDWRPLTKEMNAAHARAMSRRQIPIKTGRLKASLTRPVHPDRVVMSDRRGLSISTRVPYAKYQRKRIRRLNRAELREIFIKPIELAFEAVARS